MGCCKGVGKLYMPLQLRCQQETSGLQPISHVKITMSRTTSQTNEQQNHTFTAF